MFGFFVLIIFLIGCIYFYIKQKQSYWRRKGVAEVTPEFFFGNFRGMVNGTTIMQQIFIESYWNLKKQGAKHGGIYFFLSPVWMVIDPKLIQQVYCKDSTYFESHGLLYSHKDDVFTQHIFSSEKELWRKLRTKLTPTFSSGKLKTMFEILDFLGDRLENKVVEISDKHEVLDIRELAACFGTDVIANCAFGVDCNTMDDPNNEFRFMGKYIFKPRFIWEMIENLVNWEFLNFFGYTRLNKKVHNFFLKLVRDVVDYREKNNVTRNDYLNILLEMKNKKVTNNNDNSKGDNEPLTFEEVAANIFIMYGAGFETTSTTTSFMMYELAKRPDIQEKVRQEIYDVCKDNPEQKLTYESLKDMKYTDMVIDETLRMHSVGAHIPRKCTANYKIPGTDIVIEEGTRVTVPSWAIHNDPEYFPNPREFNPENFSETAKAQRKEVVYFPYGEGPRLCLGRRFAQMQIKIALSKYLTNFRYTLNPKTPETIGYVTNGITLEPKEDLLLDVERI